MMASAFGASVLGHFGHGSAVGGVLLRSQEREIAARDHAVSEMAPPSRMMRAQRALIAANISNTAAPIFNNICRPWLTIFAAV
jgi:hypothetical protein